MTLTLLVDIDNPLLGNDMETFIPAYLGAMGLHLANRVAPVLRGERESTNSSRSTTRCAPWFMTVSANRISSATRER